MFELVADNPHFVVVNKLEAMSFHSDSGADLKSDENDKLIGLFEFIRQQLDYPQLYPVHRLDKLTTGLMILAKTAEVAAEFGKLFESRRIDKYYIALSNQKPKKKQGWIKGDMAKSRRSAYKLLRSQHNPARTQFISIAVDQGHRLFLVKPHTGKTHQIRVALKSLGSAILGDSLYQGDNADRGYLHAYGLAFELYGENYQWCCKPTTGKWFNTDMVNEHLTLHWSKPWTLF